MAVGEAPGTDCPVLFGTPAGRVNPGAGEPCRRLRVLSHADGPSGAVAQCPGGRSWHGAWSFFPGPLVSAGVRSGAGAVVEVGGEGGVAASAHFPAQCRAVDRSVSARSSVPGWSLPGMPHRTSPGADAWPWASAVR